MFFSNQVFGTGSDDASFVIEAVKDSTIMYLRFV